VRVDIYKLYIVVAKSSLVHLDRQQQVLSVTGESKAVLLSYRQQFVVAGANLPRQYLADLSITSPAAELTARVLPEATR